MSLCLSARSTTPCAKMMVYTGYSLNVKIVNGTIEIFLKFRFYDHFDYLLLKNGHREAVCVVCVCVCKIPNVIPCEI